MIFILQTEVYWSFQICSQFLKRSDVLLILFFQICPLLYEDFIPVSLSISIYTKEVKIEQKKKRRKKRLQSLSFKMFMYAAIPWWSNVQNLHFHCQITGSIPCQGTMIPQAVHQNKQQQQQKKRFQFGSEVITLVTMSVLCIL